MALNAAQYEQISCIEQELQMARLHDVHTVVGSLLHKAHDSYKLIFNGVPPKEHADHIHPLHFASTVMNVFIEG